MIGNEAPGVVASGFSAGVGAVFVPGGKVPRMVVFCNSAGKES